MSLGFTGTNMAIHLALPIEPFNGTKEQWQLYYRMQVKAGEACYAYADTMSILGLFSIKKNKALKEALNQFHIARDKYCDTSRS